MGKKVSSQYVQAVLEKSPSIPLCKRGKQSECQDLLRCYVFLHKTLRDGKVLGHFIQPAEHGRIVTGPVIRGENGP